MSLEEEVTIQLVDAGYDARLDKGVVLVNTGGMDRTALITAARVAIIGPVVLGTGDAQPRADALTLTITCADPIEPPALKKPTKYAADAKQARRDQIRRNGGKR